jgi:hypothetical protein
MQPLNMTEQPMQYKTIVLQLLQDRPIIYDKLLRERTLLSTLDFHATELRDSHLEWKDLLSDRSPDKDPSQIASEAMEIAVEELVKHLPCEVPEDMSETLSLDGPMAFIRSHTPPA